jgi:hypothetical protein
LYNKIPMPRCAARGETRVGNWTAPVYPLDEERSAVYERDEDTMIQMFEALGRIADGPEERGDKLHAFTQRKRPLHGQLKTYRCRAYPTAKQAKILKKFCQVQTFDAYNAAIDVIKEKPSCSLTWVRNRVKAALNWDKRDDGTSSCCTTRLLHPRRKRPRSALTWRCLTWACARRRRFFHPSRAMCLSRTRASCAST